MNLIWSAFSGDMPALSALFVIMIPFVLVYAGIVSLLEKRKGGGKQH